MGCLSRLLAWLFRIDWRASWTAAPARGGGPALDRALAGELTPAEFDEWWDELHVEAAERGLEGPDRARWIERQISALSVES